MQRLDDHRLGLGAANTGNSVLQLRARYIVRNRHADVAVDRLELADGASARHFEFTQRIDLEFKHDGGFGQFISTADLRMQFAYKADSLAVDHHSGAAAGMHRGMSRGFERCLKRGNQIFHVALDVVEIHGALRFSPAIGMSVAVDEPRHMQRLTHALDARFAVANGFIREENAAELKDADVFSLAVEIEAQNIHKTAQQLDQGEFGRAVEALAGARQIFLHGKNASAPLAQMLAFRLRRLGLQVSLLPSGGSELLEGLSQAAENDLVVLFSFSKLSREGRILLEHSRAAGYRTLAFVGRTCLPAEERADVSLFAYRGTEKEYHSMAAPAALLDALAVAAAERLGAESAERLQSLHQMKKDYFPDG